jgi:hypothetical protein
VLTDEHKKKLQAEFILVIQDEFYEVSKSAKCRYSYALKDEIVKTLKPTRHTISIENKLYSNYHVVR